MSVVSTSGGATEGGGAFRDIAPSSKRQSTHSPVKIGAQIYSANLNDYKSSFQKFLVHYKNN